MAVTPRIEIKQSQSLLMTPQLRQAINLLQLSNVELNELLAKELEHNPFLEREDDRLADAEDGKAPTIDDYPSAGETPAAEEDFAPDIDCDNEFDDFASDREGYEGGSDYSWDEYAASKTRSPDDEFDFFEKKLSGRKSLYELLDEQISLNFSVPRDKVIASRLTAFLDESGYFRGDTEEIAAKLNLPNEEIEKILNRMQTFEPSGIFARSLSECLAIQLRDNNRLDPQMQKLLDNLDLLGQRKFRELKKICAADDEDLASMIADIRALNPKPAASYDNDNAVCVIPDVFVRTNKQGDYLIELNNMSLPRILINREYYSEKPGSQTLPERTARARRFSDKGPASARHDHSPGQRGNRPPPARFFRKRRGSSQTASAPGHCRNAGNARKYGESGYRSQIHAHAPRHFRAEILFLGRRRNLYRRREHFGRQHQAPDKKTH